MKMWFPVCTRRVLAVSLALAGLAWAGADAAEGEKDGAAAAGQRLREIERAIDAGRRESQTLKRKAAALELEMATLRQGMVDAARLIQDHEQRVAELRRRLAELDVRQAAKEDVLKGQRRQMGRVLSALQRVARFPPEALIAQPMTPADTVRSAILLRAAVPEIELQVQRLRDDLGVLARARDEAARRRAELARTVTGMEAQRKRLRDMLGKKSRLRRRTVTKSQAAERRVRALARQATTLRELLSTIEAERDRRRADETAGRQRAAASPDDKPKTSPPPGISGRPITLARGTLPFPVVGRIVRRYGQADKGGLTSKGINVQTSSAAQVVATYEGRVVFAGPFRGYGQLLIIEHGEGYHSLLAGMARIDSSIGQWVLVGEPVGVMGRGSGSKPVLYVELRRNGQPINPLPWLATRERIRKSNKVSG